MKRVLLATLLILAAAGLAFAQDRIETPLLERLGIPQEDIERIEQIRFEAQKTIQEAEAELAIYRARIRKLLLNAEADLREVEQMLREAMTYELRIRLAQIEQELKIRRLLGEENWDKIVRAMRSRNQRDRDLQERPQQERMRKE